MFKRPLRDGTDRLIFEPKDFEIRDRGTEIEGRWGDRSDHSRALLEALDKTGFGDQLFADIKPPEVFEVADARKRQILLAGPNFGCGSSREHAVWAIRDFGFRVFNFGDGDGIQVRWTL